MKSPRWPSLQLRRLGAIVGGGTPTALPDNWDGDIPFATPPDLRPVLGSVVDQTERTLTDDGAASGSAVVPAGSVLLSIRAPIGYVARTSRPMAFNQGCRALVPGDTVDSQFVVYSLMAAADELQSLGRGTTFMELSATQMAAIEIPVPPVAEQHGIADYLDRETARIDTLIEEQQRLIEMLRERRDSIVDASLAEHGFQIPGSLDEKEPYRVPDGWEVVLLGRALRQLTNGFVGPTRDILVDGGIRYIQGTHIKEGRIDFDRRPFYVSREWHEQRPRIHLQEGDVLIVQTGDIGKVAVVPPRFGEASCHALQIARVRPDLLSGEYLGAFLASQLGRHSLLLRATGALHPHLEAGIRQTPIVVPPHDVQSEIVRETAAETAKVDTLISETERFIEVSRERRSALITAAVTGQVDVGERA